MPRSEHSESSATGKLPASKKLRDRCIVSDPTVSGLDRLTHTPSGRAVVRQPYMSDGQWVKAVWAFCELYDQGSAGQGEHTEV